MITLMVFHEVEDVEHWLGSPKRGELFGPLGIKVRTFRDPQGTNRIGLIVETPDLATWHEALQTDAVEGSVEGNPLLDFRQNKAAQGKILALDQKLIEHRHMLIRELNSTTGMTRSILEPCGPTGHGQDPLQGPSPAGCGHRWSRVSDV